jgi:peptide deformylase
MIDLEDFKPKTREESTTARDIIIENICKLVPADKYDFNNPDYDISEVVETVVNTAKKHNLPSLSATQLGLYSPVFVIKQGDSYEVFVNPRIVHVSDDMATATEYCASFPTLGVKISRPYTIRVRYQNMQGDVVTANLDKAKARLFQHEMTHINGTMYWDDANFLNRSKAIKDWKSIKRKLQKAGII